MQHATQSKLASVLYNGREKQSTAEGGKTVPVMNAWGWKRPESQTTGGNKRDTDQSCSKSQR